MATRKGPEAVILGSGGHAVSIFETVTACGYEVLAFVDPLSDRESVLERPIVSQAPRGERLVAAVGVGHNLRRQRLLADKRFIHPQMMFPPMVHPSASVASTAKIGAGSMIMQGAMVGSGVQIGDFCIVSTGVAIAHESRMDDFASLLTGALVAGGCRIGLRSAVCMGSSVHHGIRIGDDTVIGAASFVNADVPDLTVAYGTPARIVRQRDVDDQYL